MRRLGILFLFGIALLDCNSQSIYQTFYGKDSSEYIEFIDHKKIKFLTHDYSGQGLYKLKKHRLIVQVLEQDKSLESNYRIIKDSTISSGYIIKGYVSDEYGNALPGVTLSYKNDRKYDAVITDMNGFFYKEISALKMSEISATYIGYTQCIIPPIFSKLVEYQIIMKEPYYFFLDNKILKAEIYFDDNLKIFTIKSLKIKN